jgi:hypothetical protein
MQCKQCGDPMAHETVIRLRRSLTGFRETRSQGAYCLTCRIAVPIEAARSSATGPSIAAMPRTRANGLCSAWLRTAASGQDAVTPERFR